MELELSTGMKYLDTDRVVMDPTAEAIEWLGEFIKAKQAAEEELENFKVESLDKTTVSCYNIADNEPVSEELG